MSMLVIGLATTLETTQGQVPPGGLGVFEAAMLVGSPAQGRAGILAALLLYRVIYNLGPFVLAAAALAGEEARAALSSTADKP